MGSETSYGIVPLNKNGGKWLVLLIQHSSSRYWGFPKGHAENNESPQEAATRELKEETNLDVVRLLSEDFFEEHYRFTFKGHLVDKTVFYFVAEVRGQVELQQQEVSDYKWVPLNEAEAHLTYATDQAVLRSAITLLH